MDIYRLEAADVPGWAWSAAECIAEARMASGGLSRNGSVDVMRSVVSLFRGGIPESMDVFCDDEGSWLWVEHVSDTSLQVRAGYCAPESDLEQWADFVRDEFSGLRVSWCVWGETDSLTNLVEQLELQACSVVLGGVVSSLLNPVDSSGAWLRPMGAGELMRFQVAAANELGVALVAAGKFESVDEARRAAFREIEAELGDGVASPGHRLYSLCYGGQTVGGAWIAIDGGVAVVRSVVLDSGARGQGHRRAALAALAAAAHMEGARQLQTTVVPPSHPFTKVLTDMGMSVISTDYIHTPTPRKTLAFQNA